MLNNIEIIIETINDFDGEKFIIVRELVKTIVNPEKNEIQLDVAVGQPDLEMVSFLKAFF